LSSTCVSPERGAVATSRRRTVTSGPGRFWRPPGSCSTPGPATRSSRARRSARSWRAMAQVALAMAG